MKLPLSLLLAGVATTLGACGGTPDAVIEPAAVSAEPTAAEATPPPALANGTLGRIPDTRAGNTRLGYVNLAAAARFEGPLSRDEVVRLVLGSGGAAAIAETPGATTGVSVGEALVVDGEERTVTGTPSERKALADTSPQVNVITDETRSAVQSGLGDAAAEVIVGPNVLGFRAAIGASLLDTPDAPAGPKLVISAAPHFFRQLHRIEDAMKTLFPAGDLPAAKRPRIGEEEIGERDIMRAAVAVDTVDPALLREFLRGGPALRELGRTDR